MSESLLRASSRVIVALDIDGAVIPVAATDALRPEGTADTEHSWQYLRFPELHFGSIVAAPVKELLHDLDRAAHVDRRWHSSWWTESWDVDRALGLPRATMLGTEAEYLRDEVPPAPSGHGPMDWKTAAVLRTLATLGPHDRLVWVEDEIDYFVEKDGTADLLADPRLVVVRTDTSTGIDSRGLAVIRAAARV